MAEKDATARLRRAVKENNLFLVKRLIQRTDMRNPDPTPRRFTSLAWAAVLGHEETFEFLLSAGHDDEEYSRDAENNTILILLADLKPPTLSSYSVQSSNPDFMAAALRMARLYFDRYPNTLDWANDWGKTALHVASLRGNEELVRMLCDLGADFDLADNEGNTALHYASAWGHIPIVQLLIERGCSYNVKNNEGYTASDYAYSYTTKDTLQDAARTHMELAKKARRRVAAEAAQKGNEWNGTAAPPPPASLMARSRRVSNGNSRLRSGSGASRTTATSDSGDLDGSNLMPGRPPGNSISSVSTTSSPSQISGNSSSGSFFHVPSLTTAVSAVPSGASTSSTNTFSPTSPAASQSTNSLRTQPPSHHTNPLSPVATRMREQDASAMEKWRQTARNRSGSTETNASAPLNTNNAAVPRNGQQQQRMLRPSASAAQLRSVAQVPPPLRTNQENRSRAGTTPTFTNRAGESSSYSPPGIDILSATPSRTSFRRESSLKGVSRDVGREYTGPSIDYAQFPPPPTESSSSHSSSTVTAGTTPTSSTKRSPFTLLTKQFEHPSSMTAGGHHHHRRGNSTASLKS